MKVEKRRSGYVVIMPTGEEYVLGNNGGDLTIKTDFMTKSECHRTHVNVVQVSYKKIRG